MVQMVQYDESGTTGELMSIKIDIVKGKITGTTMLLMDDKDRQEQLEIRCYQCQKMVHYESTWTYKVIKDKAKGIQHRMDWLTGKDTLGL